MHLRDARFGRRREPFSSERAARFSLELAGSRRDGEFRTNMHHMAEETELQMNANVAPSRKGS